MLFRSALDTEVIIKVVTMRQTPQVVRDEPKHTILLLVTDNERSVTGHKTKSVTRQVTSVKK